MLDFIVLDKLDNEFKEEIWNLILLADNEFVPPLSSRNSTVQVSFNKNNIKKCYTNNEENIKPYFDALSLQSFIIVVENKRVSGFLSYIPNHKVDYKSDDGHSHCIISEYVSTIFVLKDERNKGLTKKMYEILLNRSAGKTIATRTWSENHSHIYILNKLGFENFYTVKNDRGRGIDTVYYRKML